jgi:hypothetical protein
VSEPPPPAERVRVTSPRPVRQRPPRRTGASEIDAQSQLGEIYMSSLLRSQARLAGIVLVALAVLVGGLPLLFTAAPSLAHVHVLGMPLPWVLLGFAVYPVMFGLGWFYVRASERTERDFTDVVER